MDKLNLGCGNDYKKGWINLDVIDVKKDVNQDINKIPWPFKKDTFNEILMKMILEHVEKPIEVSDILPALKVAPPNPTPLAIRLRRSWASSSSYCNAWCIS